MRTWFIVFSGLSISLTIVFFFLLPDSVAVHFGAGGQADARLPREAATILIFGIQVFLFLMLLAAPSLMLRSSPAVVNLPNREYWLRESNRPELRRKLERAMSSFGIALFLFFLIIQILAFQANRSEPAHLNVGEFLAAFVLFLLYTGVWIIRLYRALRFPVRKLKED